jgi:hypothetical protein
MLFLSATYLRFLNDYVSNYVSPDPNQVTKAMMNEGYLWCGVGARNLLGPTHCVCSGVSGMWL